MRADLWGPVETGAASDWFCGAEKGTNNTGELIGIGEALVWLRDAAAMIRIPVSDIRSAKSARSHLALPRPGVRGLSLGSMFENDRTSFPCNARIRAALSSSLVRSVAAQPCACR